MEKKSIIYIVLTAFFFGTLEVASKLGGASFNAIQLVFLRFMILRNGHISWRNPICFIYWVWVSSASASVWQCCSMA